MQVSDTTLGFVNLYKTFFNFYWNLNLTLLFESKCSKEAYSYRAKLVDINAMF